MDFRETVTISSLVLRNVAGTFLNTITNTTTAARTWTLQDKSYTLAGTDDTHAATSKTTPVNADEIPLQDSAASFALAKLTLTNLKAFLKTYFDTVYLTTPIGTIAAFAGAVSSGYLTCDGTASGDRTTHAALFQYLVTDQGYSTQTFTVTIAAPAVLSKTAHGFTGGERVRLSTTGALPTGLNTTTDYYVVYVSANTYQLSSTFGGTVITTTGSQSGTHSYLRSLYGLGNGTTTFNVPDYRGQHLRGLDTGASIDTGRALGSNQTDMLKTHTHPTLINTANLFDAAGGVSYYGVQAAGTTPTSATGGVETRGKNVAVNYGIKY